LGVEVPLYILVPLVLLAVLALAERVLLPAVRVVLRRRVRAFVERLNARLALKLQPFKLTRKRTVEEMLVHDPEVAQAAADYRAEHGLSWDEVTDLVRVYAREIVPRFNAYFYYRGAHWLARRIARAFYRVRVSFLDRRALAAIDPESSVVFVMNHRSNFDYILVSYLVSRHAAVSYAVGEWARVWPLDTLLRRLGAYFVRRNTADALYRKVLERFVQLSTESGVTQGIFPEGRLTRDGRLGEARLGLLSYLLRRFDPAGRRDLVFIPVGINYDRVLEDRTHALQLEGRLPHPSLGHAAALTLRWLGKYLWLLLRGRFSRFGWACVNFGVPMSVKGYLDTRGRDLRTLPPEQHRAEVEHLGTRLMEEIARAVPVTPVALTARALLEREGASVPLAALCDAIAGQLDELHGSGAARNLNRNAAMELAIAGVRMLSLRRVVRRDGDEVSVNESERTLLEFYANSVVHLFPKPRDGASAPLYSAS
jgi:glycerol-3-phosphate O-acyltransferase